MRLSQALLLIAAATASYAQPYMNLDFETSTRGRLRDWPMGGAGYEYVIDTEQFHSGKQSLRIRDTTAGPTALGSTSQLLPMELIGGKRVRISGWIKTENVTGYAAIWFRIDGLTNFISLDNMSDQGPHGTQGWRRYEFVRDVSPNGVRAVLGVFLSGTGTAWFDDMRVEIDGKPMTQGAGPNVGEPTPQQLDWIKRTAIPIAGASPALGHDDLQPLKALIGNARVVALGEGTHGTSEYFQMKHRIIEFLASEMGFTTFAIEANMPEAYAVNDYVLNGRGDPKQLLKGMYFWTWNTHEVLDMILWMRDFNQSGKGRILFTGFDMQTASVAASVARAFVASAEAEYLPTVDAAYKLASDVAKLTPAGAAQYAAQYNAANQAVTTVRQHLESKRTEYLAKAPAADVDWAIQNARVVEQATRLLTSSSSYRDEQMAANFNWIVDQAPAGSKFVIWAHNGHVYRGSGAMGSYLSAKYGSDYAVLGFAMHEGTYSAGGPRGLTTYEASASFPGSAEYYFHKTGMPAFILDLRKAVWTDPASAFLMDQIEFRSGIGSVAMDGFYPTLTLTSDYDALIFFDQTKASALLPF